MLKECFEPILIEESKADSRSLILPHQQAAVDAMTSYFRTSIDTTNRNGLVVMPTGSGKTFTAVNWLLSQGVANGYRIIWLVHRQELVEQTYREFRRQAPILKRSGIEKLKVYPISGESQHIRMVNAYKADIYVCSIASVANKYGYRFIERMVGAAGKRKLIIVIDEAHHATAAGYQKVIKRLTALNPFRILLGLTATPTRMQESEKRILDRMFNVDTNIKNGIGRKGYVYEITLPELIKSKFLSNPHYVLVETNINGEIEFQMTPEDEAFFAEYHELSEKLKANIARSAVRNKIILDEYWKNQEKYGKTLIFAVNQDHAKTLYDDFKKANISCEYVIASKPNAQETIRDFKDNKFKVLINVLIMTEGSDVPDVQTVFLTCQTNSDSRLMQMIGRGLRGEKAHGTKDAFIVSFHDVWNRFLTFLDPRDIGIFDVEENEEVMEAETDIQEEKPIEPDNVMLEYLAKIGSGEITQPEEVSDITNGSSISSSELYLKLYHLMHASLTSERKNLEYPVGWYSVLDNDGNDVSVLVFKSQIKVYNDIENSIDLIKGKITVDDLREIYFGDLDAIPNDEELQYILDYIEETDSMPMYFAFEQRDALDPKKIGEKANELFTKEEDKEEWLKKLFDSHNVLQNIYHTFFAFKKTVFDSMKEQTEPVLKTVQEELKSYEIIENYHHLNESLKEVMEMYPLLSTKQLVKIAWTNEIVQDYFALTEWTEDYKYYQIHVNKILSSPRIDREVIKYLIFHELLHGNGYMEHNIDFRLREWQYPDSANLDAVLDNLRVEYNVDSIFNCGVKDERHSFEGLSDTNCEILPKENALHEAQPTFDSNAHGVMKGFKYCMNCGMKLPEKANYCSKCGTNVEY
ncbi:DEAD/DEAH box helicase family protein [Ruminococcus flavefaciens]|uniref:Superfamily II DNA or RNA helicase n=1 Tax=Ruminococcus flavefaciens TaxID=1265 RepID=A0A1M7IG43_RUMFL|nr:DEAD/DEAH box helicase family protein [Ruminococcus flavefaciens]SHM39721.1 Superfamily II DNA or RNA helicase [Ruminococcus flavefaciens]